MDKRIEWIDLILITESEISIHVKEQVAASKKRNGGSLDKKSMTTAFLFLSTPCEIISERS